MNTDANRLVPEPMLTTADVADLYGVDSKTVNRWARDGKLPADVTTPGGHRRWRESTIREHMNGSRS